MSGVGLVRGQDWILPPGSRLCAQIGLCMASAGSQALGSGPGALCCSSPAWCARIGTWGSMLPPQGHGLCKPHRLHDMPLGTGSGLWTGDRALLN